PHSFLAAWRVVSLEARDSDVFSRGSAVRIRSDVPVGERRGRPAADGFAVRSLAHGAGMGARLSLRHRSPRPELDTVRGAHVSDETPLVATASQTVGPFFSFGLTTNAALGRMAGPDTPGELIRLDIQVLDGAGMPV